jgi:hypothetical protein
MARIAKSLLLSAVVFGMATMFTTFAFGQQIAVDEKGNISIGGTLAAPGIVQFDSTFGLSVLTYSLPFAGNPGSVLLTDSGAGLSDIIYFPGNGTLEFLSLATLTKLAAAAAAGATNIKVVSVAGYSAGEQIQVDSGASLETRTIQSVGTSGAAGTGITLTTPLAQAHASGAGIAGFSELADVDFLTTTTLAAAAAVGDTNIKVASLLGLVAGEQIRLDIGGNAEILTIQAVGTGGATGTGITLTTPLTRAHASGAVIDESIPPGATVTLTESATGTMWAPGVAGIGGDSSSPDLQYVFGADVRANAVPEAASVWLMVVGIGVLLKTTRRGSRS